MLVEQTTPSAHALFDATATARNLDFLDIDVDRNEMGGNLTWDPPTDQTHDPWLVTSRFEQIVRW